MGCFSWCYADTNNRRPLLIGAPAYVMCPNGEIIFEASYNGYGSFGGHDIYELVVDWNRKDIRDILRISGLNHWSEEFLNALEVSCQAADDYIKSRFAKDTLLYSEWKRTIGIDIACYDDQNSCLQFPIKITRSKEIPYSELPPSKVDKGQGFGYC